MKEVVFMRKVSLVPHDRKYAEDIFRLTNNPNVVEHLSFRNETLDNVLQFIDAVNAEEKAGKTVSRVILDESGRVIGTTTLMFIDRDKKEAHLGTWLDENVWGLGYNQLSKREILRIAFFDLSLERVFVGARKANKRSLRAQEKLGYVTMKVGDQYPEHFDMLQRRENCPVILNVIYKDDFLKRMEQ
jgi:[ribosomal protein S5]-alanine N-acetyltransferase